MQHLKYIKGGDKGALQMMESFKTLGDKLGIVLIFVGAYSIVKVLDLSPHLLERMSTIHMQRYDLRHDLDRVRYLEVLSLLGENLK